MSSILANKKLLIILGVVLVLILGLVAALVFGSGGNTAIPEDNTPVSLTWWNPDESLESNSYQEIIRNFQKLRGNQAVKIEIIKENYGTGTEYYQKLITNLAKDQGPDIFGIRNDELPAWKDYLTPITGVFGLTDSQILATYKTNFTDIVVKNTIDRDKIYTVGAYVDTLQLYYNKNILEQAKIPLPPTTWQELDLQLNSLNRRDLQNNFSQSAISLGTGLNLKDGNLSRDTNIQNFQEILPTLLLQNGGQMYDSTTDRSTFGSGRNKEDLQSSQITDATLDINFDQDNPALSSLQFYLSFAEPNSTRYSWNNNSKNNVDLFLEGKLAYLINYSTFQKEIAERNPRLNYEVAEIPQLDKQNKKTYGKFFMNGISRKLEISALKDPKDTASLKKLQKAREFLYYLSTPEAQEAYIQKTAQPSGLKSIVQKQLQGNEKIKIFAAGTLFADNYYKADVERAEKMWGNLIYRIQFENLSPSASLSRAVQEYNLAVKGGAKIRI